MMSLLSVEKKLAPTIFATILILFAVTVVRAQSPPPPPAPDYFPENWKEYIYEIDNMRVRFPADFTCAKRVAPLSETPLLPKRSAPRLF